MRKAKKKNSDPHPQAIQSSIMLIEILFFIFNVSTSFCCGAAQKHLRQQEKLTGAHHIRMFNINNNIFRSSGVCAADGTTFVHFL